MEKDFSVLHLVFQEMLMVSLMYLIMKLYNFLACIL